MMPILNPEKPKRVTLMVANTLFEALSGVRPVNWRIIIHEIVTRGISQIGKRPSYISPSLCIFTSFIIAPLSMKMISCRRQGTKSNTSFNRCRTNPTRKAIPQFRKRPHPHRKLSGKFPESGFPTSSLSPPSSCFSTSATSVSARCRT